MPTNDHTIDIPLEQVASHQSGLRNQSSSAQLRPSLSRDVGATSHRQFFHGRRRKAGEAGGGTGNIGYDGEEDMVNAVGKFYRKVMGSSVITRYLLYILPLGILIAIPIIVGATVAQGAKIGGVRIVWFFSWVEIVWASLWASKVVAHLLPYIFQLVAGVVSSGVRKYALVIRSLEIPLSLVGWGVTSLATFMPIMTRNPTQRAKNDTASKEWENVVQKILAAAVIASLIFLGEKTIIQLISIDYHRKQFAFRIKDSKHSIYLLGLLYEASRTLFPPYCNEFAEEDYAMADQLNLGKALKNKKGHSRSGSATPMRLIQDVARYGDKLTSAFGNVAKDVTGREVFNPDSAHSIVVGALEKKRTSEALAKRIWMSLVCEGREALYQDDVMDVLGPDHREQAEEAFAVLDRDANGDVSLDEMIMVVREMSRERKAIATSMHDVDQAISVLDNLLSAVVLIAVVFVFVAFLNANFVTTLATAGTALLSLSFVFSATCQEVLGSCIFVFVKHPYDVSDRVDLKDDQFVVEHISLLFTIFRRISGQNIGRTVQIPNLVLNSLWIENVSRSNAMSEQLQVDVSFDTTFDDLQILKNQLITFVTDKDNSRDFQPEVEVQILGTTDQSKLSLQVEIKHKSNWANETVRQARRSKFMCALVAALKIVPIYPPGGGGDAAGSAANPNYGVTITEGEAKEHAEASAKAREDARLVPLKKIEEAKNALSPTTSATMAGMSPRDAKIMESLTAKDPATDPARDDTWASERGDSSTLGERPSVDGHILDEVKGLLRRESTKGKRKASSEIASRHYQTPGVPTIREPQGSAPSTGYGEGYGSATGYENVRPAAPPPTYGRINKAKEACLADEHGAFKALQDAARAILTEETEKPSDFIQRVQWAESALSPILAVAVEFKLFQQLRDAGDQGLSSAALASKTKIDQKELLRILLHLKSTNVIGMTREDGVSYFQRTLATNFDPNRDSIKLARQQTRDIKTLFNSWSPHISGDMHEFGATTTYGEGNLVHSSDALFSAAKNLNIHPDIRKLSEDLFATSIGQGLEDAGFRWQPYITGASSEEEDVIRLNEAGSDARIGRNGVGLSQTISFLFETRGIYLADQEFQRRTACGLTMITSLLEAAASNYEQVYSTMTSAIEDFISSDEDIVVTDSPTIEMREYPFVNTDTVSIVRPTVEFASTTPTNANLTRLRPEAYLIPRAWVDIAERLRIYGLEVEELDYAYHGPVEALNVTSSTLGEMRYEGAVLQTVETRTVNREISLPLGSFWVSTRQKNIGLAFNALEPENIDSYVTFGIIPLEENDEYPIFRVMG
ncbi:hypothetical protein BTJ68_02510 [Hortaea werneckii EXF-2000]|uniref:EF-hand domain-containing protein n=1 Tax=Hortaea werneckii EXF-2000 TaxID=1157616 RepID=A0A1Z5TNU3_HORWE|nr:hypothetical protein BTJ68_02510 [Hortaea werneckii EXF-2000]